MGLATVLGLAPRGFFIPYRYAASLPEAKAYPALAARFDAYRDGFAAVLDAIDGYADAFRAIGDAPPPAPRWDQDWFPPLDAATAYAIVRRHAPRRIVEVGSGHSTRFLMRALADGGIGAGVLAIDPAPRADIATLPMTSFPGTVQAAGADCFAGLVANDILFIDSSHILMPGSDVDVVLNDVLPTLAPGVLVHFHDIFLPDAYPREWRWRGYNEQLGVAPLVTSGAYEPIFASRYVATRMAERLQRSVVAPLPRIDGAVDSSLWLRKLR